MGGFHARPGTAYQREAYQGAYEREGLPPQEGEGFTPREEAHREAYDRGEEFEHSFQGERGEHGEHGKLYAAESEAEASAGERKRQGEGGVAEGGG